MARFNVIGTHDGKRRSVEVKASTEQRAAEKVNEKIPGFLIEKIAEGPEAENASENPTNNYSKVITIQMYSVIALLFALLISQIFRLTSTTTSSTSWEYKRAGINDEYLMKRLTEWGDEGWELVTSRRASTSLGPVTDMILKRAK
jgi:hypothetical protein